MSEFRRAAASPIIGAGSGSPFVPFFMHDLGQAEVDAITQVLAQPILTTGETVATFEKQFSEYLGIAHALGVTSCTGAMHLSLLAMDVGPGDEVITTPMTFVATALSILQAGATPVFVDVEEDTGNIDVERIASAITSKTKAIIPVHLYGLMADMQRLREVADSHRLAIIEDCAHCIEGSRDGVRPGELGDTACFSFYATKNLTSGEGGAVVCREEELKNRLRVARLHGMDKTAFDRHKEGYSHWDMVCMGWKYNMDNIQAALLLPQMARIKNKLKERHRLAALYESLLSEAPQIRLIATRDSAIHARHLFPVRVPSECRDEVIVKLKNAGIESVVNYSPIHLLTYFRDRYGYQAGDFPIAETLGGEVLSLPFYPGLKDDQVNYVVQILKRALEF